MGSSLISDTQRTDKKNYQIILRITSIKILEMC